MNKLLLHESKRRVGSPGVFITPGTYFIIVQAERSHIYNLLLRTMGLMRLKQSNAGMV